MFTKEINFEATHNRFGTTAGREIATEMFGELTRVKGQSAFKTACGKRLTITCLRIIIRSRKAF